MPVWEYPHMCEHINCHEKINTNNNVYFSMVYAYGYFPLSHDFCRTIVFFRDIIGKILNHKRLAFGIRTE